MHGADAAQAEARSTGGAILETWVYFVVVELPVVGDYRGNPSVESRT
jgi:hypothetical protein